MLFVVAFIKTNYMLYEPMFPSMEIRFILFSNESFIGSVQRLLGVQDMLFSEINRPAFRINLYSAAVI